MSTMAIGSSNATGAAYGWMPRKVHGCIGFAWLSDSELVTREIQDRAVIRYAACWARETGKRACVIVSGSTRHEEDNVDVLTWEWLGRDLQFSGGLSRDVVGDVVQLSGLRLQYGATWVSLGLLGGEVSLGIGGLCDGLVILVPRGCSSGDEKGFWRRGLRESAGVKERGSRGLILGYMDVDLD